jgi:hypothetical protein
MDEQTIEVLILKSWLCILNNCYPIGCLLIWYASQKFLLNEVSIFNQNRDHFLFLNVHDKARKDFRRALFATNTLFCWQNVPLSSGRWVCDHYFIVRVHCVLQRMSAKHTCRWVCYLFKTYVPLAASATVNPSATAWHQSRSPTYQNPVQKRFEKTAATDSELLTVLNYFYQNHVHLQYDVCRWHLNL